MDKTSTAAKRRRHTLRDVARLAEVDVSTVSRSLNGDPRISEERALEIRRLAESLGYRPKPFRGKYAQAVGLLYAAPRGRESAGNDFVQRMTWLAQEQLAKRGFFAHLEAVRPDQDPLPLLVRQNRVDGVLLLGFFPARFAAALLEFEIPAVAVNDTYERLGIPCVRSDPEPATAAAVMQLAARGHQRFALLVSNPDYPTVRARVRAFGHTLSVLGLPENAARIVSGLPSALAGGREGAARVLEEAASATAVLCENDWMALGALEEFQRRGIRVPGEISLVGHDNLWVCAETSPALSSIHRDESRIVAGAVDLLTRAIRRDGDLPLDVVVEETAVLRDSVGPAPARRGAEAAE